ncbi:MAG: hypothetical protein AAF384_06885 [Pseudomonadota bacterium]
MTGLAPLLTLLCSLAVNAATRPNDLIFDEPVFDAKENRALYISSPGLYYAQLVVNRGVGDLANADRSYALEIEIYRGDKLLMSRGFHNFELPGDLNKILFRFTTDRELPLRKHLSVAIRVKDHLQSTAKPDLRLQITRVRRSHLRFP